MELNRREFASQAAAVVASSVAWQELSSRPGLRAGDAVQPDQLPIVDTHQHLWDLEKFKLPWLDGAPSVLKRSYGMPDYFAATAGLNVVRAVYMEVDVAPEQQLAEAEHLLAICRAGNSPTVGAVISGRPNSPAFRDYILKFKNNPHIKGVRQVLHSPEAMPKLCLEPQFVRSIQLLGELGKSFDLCMRPTELADAGRLIDQCPHTKFILDHCGNADPKAFVTEAAQHQRRRHVDEQCHDTDAAHEVGLGGAMPTQRPSSRKRLGVAKRQGILSKAGDETLWNWLGART